MRLPLIIAATLLFRHVYGAAATNPKDDNKEEEAPPKPCTIRSPNTGSFFDLNPLHITLPDPESKAGKDKDTKPESWHARGYDYGANFTINFCGAVVENLHGVQGIPETRWGNVSAFYVKDGKTFSIGYVRSHVLLLTRLQYIAAYAADFER